ncbi:MAG: hypothetical protein GXY48_06915 [Methanomicrobiales archaeon]|nr:hypothetical protein [Methanomicrobiales archaeon]
MYEQNSSLFEESGLHSIFIDDAVIEYIAERNTDFRISTSCGGPVLLPVSYKPPKPTDLALKAGEKTIYISMYQARYIDHIHMGLVPYHVTMRDEAFSEEYNGL